MIKRFIWWEYSRGSWQYDVIVGVILAFIFLTPREWFRDQPRIAQAKEITALGGPQFLVNPEALVRVPENQRVDTLTRLLRKGAGDRNLTVTRFEPVLNSEDE